MFLLDTNTLSDARKRISPVESWLRGQDPTALFVSVITLGEIARGAELKSKRDPIASGHLTAWLRTTQTTFAERILPVTDAVAIEWGRLSAIRPRGDADGLIAATAVVHGLTVVTRNVADFADTGAAVLNPWGS